MVLVMHNGSAVARMSTIPAIDNVKLESRAFYLKPITRISKPPFEVALVVDPAKPYDRRIIGGVAAYVRSQKRDWSVYVEEEVIARLPNLDAWSGNGIIANFDDKRIARAASNANVPVVGIGGGYGYYDVNSGIPYVRTDNVAISKIAASHLLELGFQRFAFCSEPPNKINGWARERADAFYKFVTSRNYNCDVYVGRISSVRHWKESQKHLQQWLSTLSRPIGIMACHDARARQLLQACRASGFRVPEDIAIVGVDNDDIMCELSTPPLTSIEQGTRRIGHEAAALLDMLMTGRSKRKSLTVAPEGLVARQSTDVVAVEDEDVAESLRFIRAHACDPIAVWDVLDHTNLSRSTLEARFREVLGRSIHAEIRRVQIALARRLLTDTNAPIKEVAHQSGFSSVQYFTATIRDATGQTPGQIRSEVHKYY